MEAIVRSILLFINLWLKLLLIFVYIPAVCSQWIGNLSVYEISSFNNPIKPGITVTTQLDHFTVHPESGDVYVGAVNYIYRLDMDLVQVVNVSTATDIGEDYVNYNKILVLQGGRLITCGSERSGRCQSRNEVNLLGNGFVDQNVASFGRGTTESIVAPEKINGVTYLRLYVASTHSAETDDQNIPPVARRTLEFNGFMFANSDNRLTFSSSYLSGPFPINYVSAFVWKGFTYFVAFQNQDFGLRSQVSKINRVCHDSNNLDSYTEILIECQGVDGSLYSLVQSAHIGPAGPHLSESLSTDDQVLYAVFAKNDANEADSDVPIPTKGSALCVYKMSDIVTAFEDAVKGCLTEGNSYTTGYLSGTQCNTFPPSITPDYCDARGTLSYKYADGITPVESTAVLELPDHLTSSIITSIELNHTIAFIGTSQGQLLKVHIESESTARLYEQIDLGNPVMGDIDNPVMRDNMINETLEELYILTEQKLIKMHVENCGQYTTCETCIGTDAGMDGDPYCGWCTLERKCTRYHDCLLRDVSSRWLAYNDAQCIKITNIAPYDSLPITVTDQQITLTVQQLPDLLPNKQYVCHFDDEFNNQAITGDTLQCMTPPGNNIPQIINGDHVTMLLSVQSTETGVKFVDTDFNFYECSTHKSCVSCVSSRWSCDWCVFENRCTHESTSCSGPNEIIVTGQNNPESSMDGPDSCPQLQAQNGEVLISNAVDREIMVETSNLPDDNQILNYRCSLNIDGVLQSVDASRVNSTLTCNMKSYTYTANEQEVNVSLTLEWIDTDNNVHLLDDRHGFKVTLYKCEVLRPDCSRCVSEETTRAELGCVWCEDCGVIDSTVCLLANQMITLHNGLNCPDPVILEIYPLYGPIEGNTNLTLTGTDLGRRFSDLQEVKVGGQICDLDAGLEMYYKTGASVTCKTRSNSDELTLQQLLVNITGADGNDQLSTGDPTFGYKDPDISNFAPQIGPQSGGTIVTIMGSKLDAGTVIGVLIGGIPCLIDRDQVIDNNMTCITSGASELGVRDFSITFDGAVRQSTMQYTYAEDPMVEAINPSKSILSGGREVRVNGSGFSIIQKPQILITVGDEDFIGDCEVLNDAEMICVTPTIKLSDEPPSNSSSAEALSSSVKELSLVTGNVTTGFIMDGVTDLLRWCEEQTMSMCRSLEYVQDPVYYSFDADNYKYEDGVGRKDGSSLEILGEMLDLAITSEEITIYVGQELCTDINVGSQNLFCTLPEEQPKPGDNLGMNTSRNLPIVRVIHGTTLTFEIGYFSYSSGPPFTVIAVSTVSAVVLVFALVLATVLHKKSASARREVDKCLDDIDRVQLELGEDMRRAFAELQTDMTDLTSDLEGLGMPFVSQREYATNMLFVALEAKPLTSDPENPEEHVEKAMKKFADLLGNKTFLLMLIQTLDAESKSKLPVREKGEIASLLTVVMMAENKLGYLTDVLFSLMAKLVQDELDNNRPRQLFRRTETILEKLLSNWLALCLYDSVKDHTAYPLFLLYRAIKCHCESGPMDVISGQAKFTLSDEKLLTEDIESREMTMNVIVNDADGEVKEVKVLDVDSISQVKEKILDVIHRNKPYSSRPSANEVDLEWRGGRSGHLVLRDSDMSSPTLDGWKRVGTLKFYHVPNKSTMAIVPAKSAERIEQVPAAYANLDVLRGAHENRGFTGPRSNRYTVVEIDQEETARVWHLVKVEDSDFDDTKHKPHGFARRMSMMPTRPKKRFREIFIPRLIGTKGTIQEYIDHMFETILDASKAPHAVKYLFDFFDSQSIRHDIEDSNAVRIWKGNSLSLRFWSSAIRRPDFIFDIRPSRPVEASLRVIAQAFYDAHEASDQKLGKDSDLSKLLFNKDLPCIQSLVQTYYDGIARKPRVSTEDLNIEMETTCQNFTGLFSKLSTLLQLWEYISKFNVKIVEILEDDEVCQREHLAYRLTEVETVLANVDSNDEDSV